MVGSFIGDKSAAVASRRANHLEFEQKQIIQCEEEHTLPRFLLILRHCVLELRLHPRGVAHQGWHQPLQKPSRFANPVG